MRRFVYPIIAVWISVAPGLAASPSIEYQSPHEELNYRYVLEEEGQKAESWIFRFRTESGGLNLTIRSTAQRYTVTSDLAGAPSTEVVTMAEPNGTGVGEVELAWPDLRISSRYVKHEGTETLDRLEGWTPDCASIVDGPLGSIKQDLLERVRKDYVRYVEPPQHLETLLAALYAARFLPLMAGECEGPQEPQGGACYYDHLGYSDCVSCCESYSGLTMSVCGMALRSICGAPWCLGLGLGVCGGAVTAASNLCQLHNCSGKPGDPGCNQDQACEGQCISFCGPGWSSGCGSCENQGPNHQACCK